MAIEQLTVIPAGAGSGKTYSIQTTLAQWIRDNEVAPERIVAVTFTEAAAAELRGRIRDELVRQSRHEDALKLEQAYITTIHGFGLRLLGEFAFDIGMNPSPRLLTEDEEKILIRLALAADDQALMIMKDLSRFGYQYDFNSGKGPEDQFRTVVLSVMAKLRSIGHHSVDESLVEQAVRRIAQLYGPVSKAESLHDNLLSAIRRLLKAFPGDISTQCKLTSGVQKNVAENHKLLRRAAADNRLQSDWSLWLKLRKLQTSTARNKLPEDYEELLQQVIDAADRLLDHPGPLADAQDHSRALLNSAQSSLEVYAQHKAQRGLLDFADMLSLSRQMLLNTPDVLNTLKERFQCLIIDEFQDTNPLQFSLLWMFRDAGIPTLVVGDVKQAIMGFQNADARLLSELQHQHASACAPLTGNWRTHQQLMPWVNAVGAGLFGAEYIDLEPKADFASSLAPLEVIDYSAAATIDIRTEHTVARIRELLVEEALVFDRSLKIQRPIRGGDIAIICPTNKRLKTYAKALRAAGIRARLSEDGWFATRLIQLIYHALCFVADPTDRHAELYLSVTELGEETLQSALNRMLQQKRAEGGILEALSPLRDEVASLSIPAACARVIDVLNLYGVIATQPDADQARANLLRLQAEADVFEQSNREALASGGFYGNELKSFLAWLKSRVEEDDSQPDPRVQDDDAVQLETWHRSKGREWPIVVVAATESEILCKLPSFDVNYQDFDDLSKLLEKARLDVSPSYSAPEKNEALLETLWPKAVSSAQRLLYVALTRAREKIILEWPGYLDNGKERSRVTYWEQLVADVGLELAGNQLMTNGKAYSCRVVKVGKDRPELFDGDPVDCSAPLPVYGRRAIIARELPQGLTPEMVRPSLHGDEISAADLDIQTEVYAEGIELDSDLPANEQGTLLHRCFELLDHLDSGEALKRATTTELSGEQFGQLKNNSSAFYCHLEQRLGEQTRQHEVSILATNEQGSVINGFIDLLVETAEGFWIVDHKSDRTDDRVTRFREHLPQLLTYLSAISKLRPEKPVLGVAINWISAGEVSWLLCD